MRHHEIDLTDPSDKGEYVEVRTPAGIIRVNAGLIKPATGQEVVVVELHQGLEWTMETAASPSGRTDIKFVRI